MNYNFEIEKVFEIIDKNLFTYPGKEKLKNIKEFEDIEKIDEEFLKIEELKKIKEEGEIPFEFPDLSNFEKELLKEKIFLPSELFKFLIFFKGIERIKKEIDKSEFLKERFFKEYENILPIFKELDKVFDEKGEIKDEATHELYKIRNEKKKLINKIFGILKNKIEEIGKDGFLKDNEIRLREGRFTILLDHSVAKRFGVVHGYSKKGLSAYVEPFESIEVQNLYKEIEEKEKEEIEKICIKLSEILWKNMNSIKRIYEDLGEIDLLNSKVLFSKIINGEKPLYSKNKFFRLREVCHPLLLLSKKEVLPYNFDLPEDVDIFVISGPNGGGKTVFLKTLGIIIKMLQFGIPVPSSPYSHFYLPDKVYGIGFEIEGKIEEGESNFTSHLKAFNEIIKKDEKDIILLVDEYMANTDPEEGSALGFSIIKEFLNKGIKSFFVTHLNGIKIFVEKENDKRIKNVSFGFDKIKKTPTYKISMDTFEESYAFEIAEKLFLNKEIIDRARKYTLNLSEMLKEMKEKMEKIEMEYKKFCEEKQREIKREKERIKKEMMERVYKIEKEIEEIIKEIKKEKSMKKVREAKQKIVYYKKILEDKLPEEIKIGEFYKIDGFENPGKVIGIHDNDVFLKVGDLKFWVPKEKLSPLEKEIKKEVKKEKVTFIPSIKSYSLSIRGLKKEDALDEIEKFIYETYSKGAEEVRIIHGIGDGVLKLLVWDYLKKLKFVKEFFHPPYNEGGYGVTVIRFKND